MGIMMESDGRTIDRPDPCRRICYEHVEAFCMGGVRGGGRPVNFYDGGDVRLRFSTSDDPDAAKMRDAPGDPIVECGKRAAQ